MVGLEVNLAGSCSRTFKITTETVEGKPVLVIEGAIVGEARKPVEVPRLRFSVRDAQGAEIYAWNAVLELPVLKPGERAWFKSRLASPPPEGRNIDIRSSAGGISPAAIYEQGHAARSRRTMYRCARADRRR